GNDDPGLGADPLDFIAVIPGACGLVEIEETGGAGGNLNPFIAKLCCPAGYGSKRIEWCIVSGELRQEYSGPLDLRRHWIFLRKSLPACRLACPEIVRVRAFLFPGRAAALSRGRPDVDVPVARIFVDLGQFLRAEFTIGEGSKAVLDLARPAGSDERR